MNNNAPIMKRWTLTAVGLPIALYGLSWITTSEAVADFTSTAGMVMLPVTGVMAFIWKQEIDKATGKKKSESTEG